LAKKPNEVHLTFCIDGVARDQFQTLCKTYNVSASTVLREWVESALRSGSIDKETAPDVATTVTKSISNTDKKVIENILSRLDEVERNTAYLNDNQMQFIKEEVLGDSLGSLRNRMGVVENQVQELGGNITR
tara:strand:- start:222 stop:617 length:396 start_codon:yes stop_codon:yes gene_type:complete